MLPINTWKFLLSGGMVGLLFSSILMTIVLYRLSPKLQSRRLSSLRDQHIDPIPRYGGVALFWGFLGALSLVWWFPFVHQGLGLQFLSVNQLAGFCIGGFMAWGIGFADDIFLLRARWKLAVQIGIALVMKKHHKKTFSVTLWSVQRRRLVEKQTLVFESTMVQLSCGLSVKTRQAKQQLIGQF